MKKSILKLGKSLNKLEQRQISGGRLGCRSHEECIVEGECCISGSINGSGYCGSNPLYVGDRGQCDIG